jgi:hypothetical protein
MFEDVIRKNGIELGAMLPGYRVRFADRTDFSRSAD